MSGGRTLWLAQDVERHRRALMVELQDTFGPVALAVDVVLCAKAKLQNDPNGAIRDGFASVAREAGMAGRAKDVREFVEGANAIGWLDDLTVDEDGRRFSCRISGWKADQDRAYASWRKRDQRANGDLSPNTSRNGDKSPNGPKLPNCPTTEQNRTEELPPLPPQGGHLNEVAPERPTGNRKSDLTAFDKTFASWTERYFPGCRPRSVLMVVSELRANGGVATPEAVNDFASQRPQFKNLVKPEEEAA